MRLVIAIEQQQIRCLDTGEMPPFRIHQELLAVRGHGQAEMIGDPFMQLKYSASRNSAARSMRSCPSSDVLS